MNRKFLIFVLLIHLNQSSVVLKQDENKQKQSDDSRKLYQTIQGQQFVPVQQTQPIIYQQPQTITPVYQNIVPTIQTTPIQVQQQPIQVQTLPQLPMTNQVQNTPVNQNRKLISNKKKITKKLNKKKRLTRKWVIEQIKEMEKNEKFVKLINSKKSYRRKLELVQSKNTSQKKRRELWGWIRRIFRRIRRAVRRVVRRVRRHVRRVIRRARRIFRPKPRPKSASYYARKYPMPIKPKLYLIPGQSLKNKPEECILFMEFLPMYYVSILRKSSFRINFSSNCFYSKDVKFETNFEKTRHLNLDSHPTEVKLFLFENFVEMDFKNSKLLDDTDLMVSKKYQEMTYRHKGEYRDLDLNYQNSVFIKPDVRNSFSRYNFDKIKNSDTIQCKAKSKRVYKPGLPESVFWETLKIPVLPGYRRHRKKGFWTKYMGKYYQVQKSKLMLHPYNTKFFIKAPYYIVSTRMKKGPYYDNYIRLPKGDMMVKYSGKEAFIRYPTKVGNKTQNKVIKLLNFKNAFYYKTEKIFTFPVILDKNRLLGQKNDKILKKVHKKRQERKLKKLNKFPKLKNKPKNVVIKQKQKDAKKKREEYEREKERIRQRTVQRKYGSFQDLKAVRNKLGVVKTEILCYLT